MSKLQETVPRVSGSQVSSAFHSVVANRFGAPISDRLLQLAPIRTCRRGQRMSDCRAEANVVPDDFLLSEKSTRKPSHTAKYLVAICANSSAFDDVRYRIAVGKTTSNAARSSIGI